MDLDCIVKETGNHPVATVLWLHGLGADGNDFAPVVPQLVDPGWPGLRFVFPHAPVRPVTINMGTPMRAWYDIRALSLDERADEAGVRESIAQIEALIADEVARGTPASRIVLAGFSQGGAMALQAGLRHSEPLAGIIGLSCYLPMAQSLANERATAGTGTPVLLMHGSRDPVVPLALGEHARRTLTDWGYRVDWRSYPMQHQVCMEQISDIRAWLGAIIAPFDSPDRLPSRAGSPSPM
jgi:phospholipase/carboxylesterase